MLQMSSLSVSSCPIQSRYTRTNEYGTFLRRKGRSGCTFTSILCPHVRNRSLKNIRTFRFACLLEGPWYVVDRLADVGSKRRAILQIILNIDIRGNVDRAQSSID